MLHLRGDPRKKSKHVFDGACVHEVVDVGAEIVDHGDAAADFGQRLAVQIDEAVNGKSIVAAGHAGDEMVAEAGEQAPSRCRDGAKLEAVDLLIAAECRLLEEARSFFWVDVHIDPRPLSTQRKRKSLGRELAQLLAGHAVVDGAVAVAGVEGPVFFGSYGARPVSLRSGTRPCVHSKTITHRKLLAKKINNSSFSRRGS